MTSLQTKTISQQKFKRGFASYIYLYMAILQITNYVSSMASKQSTSSSSSSSSKSRRPRFRGSRLQTPAVPILSSSCTTTINERAAAAGAVTSTTSRCSKKQHDVGVGVDNKLLLAQLYAIAEAAADRAEMHDVIGKQRDNWNHLLLHSINSITLAASVAAGIAEMLNVLHSHLQLAFKLSSALLFAASTAMMAVTSKIQPSQLAEEQRNATRLFRQIENSIRTAVALAPPTGADVEAATERVLALDKAYPLPLLPGMLDKFPKKLEPTVWWPNYTRSSSNSGGGGGGNMNMNNNNNNGWSKGLEDEMEGIVAKVRSKDIEQYVGFGNKVLAINKVVAVAGPVLSGLAAIAVGVSVVLGAGVLNINGAAALGTFPVLFGALATVTNTLQHGGQAGAVIELSRNCAGFYKKLGEEIESNLREGEVEKREDGDLLKLKVALKLGSSLSDLQGFIGATGDDDIGEFAGKLF